MYRMYEFFTLGMAHIHWSDNLNVLSAAFMHQLILTKSGVHIHMWTPHLKKWGSTDPPGPRGSVTPACRAFGGIA